MRLGLALVFPAILVSSGVVRANEIVPAPGSTDVAEVSPYRHFFGMQGGGTIPIGMVYRYRLWKPLLLDVAGFGAPEALSMLTGGIVIELWQSDRLLTYGGAGGSLLLVGDRSAVFAYGRIGLGVKLGARRNHRLAVDVGLWSGRYSRFDHVTRALLVDERFTIPMVGLSYLVGFNA